MQTARVANEFTDVDRIVTKRDIARVSYIDFLHHIWPWFEIEEAHLMIGQALEGVLYGETDRQMIFMPPRTGKSACVSQVFPALWLGHFADDQIMQVCYASGLAANMGRAVRQIVQSPEYQEVFPSVRLSNDRKAADDWGIQDRRGIYRAFGLTSGIAGTGWNLGIVDDPLSEQDAFSEVAKARARNWYGPGFYTRRQPGRNRICLMTTRWAHDDLAGHLLEAEKNPDGDAAEYADKWEKLTIPAILGKSDAEALNLAAEKDGFLGKRRKTYAAGGSFAVRRFPLNELMRTKATMSQKFWDALYLQEPQTEEGAIIKRSYWRHWPEKRPMPDCEMVVQFYDTAFEDKEENDDSARTTWGVFRMEDTDPRTGGRNRYAMILLDRWKDQVHFPELRKQVIESAQEWQPDLILIEGKASGKPLVQEMKRLRLPVREWAPLRNARGREMSKIARTEAASVVWEQGCVWAPSRKWADEVIEQCAQFPAGAKDDLHDTCTMAALWLRQKFWLELADELEEMEQDEHDRDEQARIREGRRLYG